MDDHEVGALGRPRHGRFIEAGEVIPLRHDGRVHRHRRLDGAGPGVCQQVREAPRVARLEHRNVVSTRGKLADHAAEKVRVAVVPVGEERVA